MARVARLVVPGCPHHITHHGNRDEDVFYSIPDRVRYLDLLVEQAARFDLEIWAYCLMANHVHLIAVARRPDSLARAIGNAHRMYSRSLNRKHGWKGHLWGNRFFSTALDGPHLWAATRYVELNPVRAGLVRRCTDYRWSSARAHASGTIDPVLADDRPFRDFGGDWLAWLEEGLDEETLEAIRRNTLTGRPTGDPDFVSRLERLTSRRLRPKRRGPKPKNS